MHASLLARVHRKPKQPAQQHRHVAAPVEVGGDRKVGSQRDRTVRTSVSGEGLELNASERVCVLTGSSGTLGTAFCVRYARNYRIVALWSRRPPLIASHE